MNYTSLPEQEIYRLCAERLGWVRFDLPEGMTDDDCYDIDPKMAVIVCQQPARMVPWVGWYKGEIKPENYLEINQYEASHAIGMAIDALSVFDRSEVKYKEGGTIRLGYGKDALVSNITASLSESVRLDQWLYQTDAWVGIAVVDALIKSGAATYVPPDVDTHAETKVMDRRDFASWIGDLARDISGPYPEIRHFSAVVELFATGDTRNLSQRVECNALSA